MIFARGETDGRAWAAGTKEADTLPGGVSGLGQTKEEEGNGKKIMREEKNLQDRKIELDCLRIIATFGVIILHVCSLYWGRTDVNTIEWRILNVYESIVRWTVPVFVMISGALFLERVQSTMQIYKKNILRIITAFIFWSAVYSVMSFFLYHSGIKWAIRQFFQGYYHMWFLFMIVGLYIVTPFLRKIVESQALMKYFLAVSFVFTFALPQGIQLLSYRFGSIGEELDGMLGNVNLYFTLGYVSYFVCGYYLNTVQISKKGRSLVYILGICGFLMTIGFTAALSVKQQNANEIFFSNFTINVMLQSIMVFVLAKQNLRGRRLSSKVQALLVKLSKYSFGAYLVHAMLIELFSSLLGFDALSFYPFFSVPAVAVVVFVLSFAISGVLHCIPVMNKFIV